MKHKKKFMILFLILSLIGIYLWTQNNWLSVSRYSISSHIPINFENYKIAQISDFHNEKSEYLQNQILDSLKQEQPDIIVITGDYIDSRHTDLETSLAFAKKLVTIAPIYYVPGNHESRKEEYPEFEQALTEIGFQVLHNQSIVIEKDSQAITLLGVLDPDFYPTSWVMDESTNYFYKELNKLTQDDSNFNILLSHRPELLDIYTHLNIDIVFTGHAHGGQIRLPFTEGIVAPDQGFFPKFTSGIHKKKNTHMIISRGLGNSLFPFRINNRPELVYVTLHHSADSQASNVKD